MGKRKSEEELSRFVWKRNVNYDINLLCEVENFNPYAFNNPNPLWTDVAECLQNNDLRMRVTARSCRERVAELLKNHRKGELASIRASGTSDAEMTRLENMLTSVSKLEEAKPSKQLKALYSKKDRHQAEAERTRALEELESGSSEDEHPNKSKKANKADDDFEFGPQTGRSSHNPKKDLVTFLEKKSENEITVRKEELRLREKEMEIREKEMENKSKELEIMRIKMDAEVEERKKMTEMLIKLATSKP